MADSSAALVAKAFEKISEMLTAQAQQYAEIAKVLGTAADGGETVAQALAALEAVKSVVKKRKKVVDPAHPK